MRGARRLGQFDRFPVSGEPVSADGTLTPAVLRNRHTNTGSCVYTVRSRDLYREKNGPLARLRKLVSALSGTNGSIRCETTAFFTTLFVNHRFAHHRDGWIKVYLKKTFPCLAPLRTNEHDSFSPIANVQIENCFRTKDRSLPARVEVYCRCPTRNNVFSPIN